MWTIRVKKKLKTNKFDTENSIKKYPGCHSSIFMNPGNKTWFEIDNNTFTLVFGVF